MRSERPHSRDAALVRAAIERELLARVAAAATEARVLRCTACGASSGTDARFCTGCGTRFNVVVAPLDPREAHTS